MIDAAFSLPPVRKSVESIIRLLCSINARGACVIARSDINWWMTWLTRAALTCVLMDPVFASAEISEQVAIESAHKALVKSGVLPPGWTFYVDKELQRWLWLKSRWQESSIKEKQLGREDTDFGPWLARMESVMVGKRVWAVVYKLTLPPGERAFHTNAMVFVDADSGRVLAFIEPEGSPQFPK